MRKASKKLRKSEHIFHVKYSMESKVFNYLSTSIKNTSHDINQFRSVLKSLLLINSFYSLEEYFAWNSNRDLGSV